MLVRTILQSGLATLLCLAVIAVAQPVAAQDDATPEELAREAARLATPLLDDAANGLLENPGAFVKVAEAPKVGAAEDAAVVDLRNIPTSDIPVELLDHPRTHIQGELDYGGFGSSTNSPSENPEVRDPHSVLFDPSEGDLNPRAGTPGSSVANWSARGYSGWIPPDTQLAVGPEYIVEAVNSGFVVYTKTGRETRAYTSFEGFVTLPTGWDGFCYDPRVVFDAYSDRFLMMIMGKDETNLTAYYWLMVSQTTDPNGAWHVFRFNASAGAVGAEQWLDYAAIGVDSWGVYVTGNYFEYGGGYLRTQLWSIDPAIMDGTSTRHYYWSDLNWPSGPNARTVQPAIPQTINSAGHTFYVNSWNGSGAELLLWTQNGKRWPESTDPDGANLSRAVVPSKTYYSMYMNVDQPGSGWDIDGGDASVRNAYYTAGGVGITLALNWDGNRAYSEVYLAVLDINGTMEYDVAVWNTNYHMNYPALTMYPSAASSADVGLTFSMTEPGSATGFIGAVGYGWDPTTNTSLYFTWQKRGEGTYVRWDGDPGTSRNRWGDYSGAAWDHTCNNAWFAAEYATASNTWATQIFARTLGTFDVCKYFHVRAPNGGQNYTAGSTQSVTWDRMNIPSGDTVYVDYYNGSSWTTIDTVAYNASSYSWSVPNTPTTSARIKVRNTSSGTTATDMSDGTFTITGLPDLIPSILSPDPSYQSGETDLVYNSVRNSGTVTAGGFNVDLRLSTNTTCTTLDTLVGSRRVTSLSGGGYLNTVSTSMTIPAGFDSGSYYLCQIIDSAGEVTEFAENNNTTYVPVTIINSLIFADGFESGNTSAW